MQTPSHLVIAAAASKAFSGVPTYSSAFLIGSVAPDVPLYVLSLVGGLYYTRVKKMTPQAAAELMFSKLFFKHPLWIVAHNLLHSPTLLLLLLVPLWWQESAAASWLFWFLASCLLHTLIDIPVHHDDGPLLFFPFQWRTRFISPVSYWDRARGAGWFMWLEGGVVVALLIYLAWPWLARG